MSGLPLAIGCVRASRRRFEHRPSSRLRTHDLSEMTQGSLYRFNHLRNSHPSTGDSRVRVYASAAILIASAWVG